jgi:23S rRNA (pseudouridine1915-N3)-methyltransferase
VELGIVAVGKLRPYYREAADDYARRLRRYVAIREYEVREASRAPHTVAQLADEANRLTTKIARGTAIVALAREGTPWTSRDLAAQVDRWMVGSRPVALVIGGSYGLDPSILAGAGARWSLGPLTLPHELARVIVLEQVYRAFTILRGEPYHKGV